MTLAQIEKVMLLRSVDIFSHCNAEEVVRIAGIASERTFDSGGQIYGIDDPADAFYCVVEGEVELQGPDDGLRAAVSCETFGAREILSGRLRSSTATARCRTVALVVEADDFFDLLSNNIEIVKALFREFLSAPEADGGEP